MPPRLIQALELLRYHEREPVHYRTNLLNAIALHAGLCGDAEIETACEREIARIREQHINEQCREQKALPISVTQAPRASGTHHDSR